MSSLNDGWQAFHREDYRRAQRIGADASSMEGLWLHALSLFEAGQPEESLSLLAQELDRSPSAGVAALMGDLLGRQGKRRDGEQYLRRAVDMEPGNGLFRSLLGEQRIRQGRWDSGTDDFVEALNLDRRRAFPHIQRVITDMVDAVSARRIPRPDAMKFINRIDYSVADKTNQMNGFFATARRSITNQRQMDRSSLIEPWSQNSPESAGGQRTSTPPKQPTSPPKRQSRPKRSPEKKSSPRSQRPSQPTQRPASSKRSSPQGPAPPPASPDHSPSNSPNEQKLRQRPNAQRAPEPDANIVANQKNMTVVMQQERQKNESLQDLIAAVHPPSWPSEVTQPIDDIQAIGFSDSNLLRGSNAIETANFRITGGEIGVQIALERCMHNLVTAVQGISTTALPMTPASIARIEFNLLDGFHHHIDDLEELYRRESEIQSPSVLAVGKFIGECIVQSYGGIWDHAVPARETVIQLGDHRLDPIGLAARFMKASDFDDVDLSQLIDEARRAVKTSTAFPTFADYIDPTSGLEGDALQMSLAELWVDYRFELQETQVQDIAQCIRPRQTGFDNIIVFSIDSSFLPTPLLQSLEGAVDGQDRCRMAYLREDGRFLVLPSRKHFRTLLTRVIDPLSPSNASTIARWMDTLFRPGWHGLTNDERVQTWRQKTGNSDLEAPSIDVDRDGTTTLVVHAVDPRGTHRQIHLRDGSDGLSIATD